MQENPNPWKQYLVLLICSVVAAVLYLLYREYSLVDLETGIWRVVDIYSYQVYLRIPMILLACSAVCTILIYICTCCVRHWKECCSSSCSCKLHDTKNLEEYNKMTKEYTKKELEKLRNSDQYLNELKKKGEAPEKWNWQMAKRLEREKNFKEGKNDHSSDKEEEDKMD
jgi:hypothetical protein